MSPIYQMNKLERERAKFAEIQQQLRSLQMQFFVGGASAEQSKEYSALRIARDVSMASIAAYEAEEADHA